MTLRWQRFVAPSKDDRELYRSWSAWVALTALDQAMLDGNPYVTAHEIRAILESMQLGQADIDLLLTFLRRKGLVARLNAKGRQNRRYYLTQAGKDQLTVYENSLKERLKWVG